MKTFALAAATTFSIAGAFAYVGPKMAAPDTAPRDAVIQVITSSGHGSAVHIGNGFALTATHVTRGGKDLKYRAPGEAEATRAVEVLWENAAYDIALIRLGDYASLASANLECRAPVIGEPISMVGNPLALKDVITYGHVAGTPTLIGPWGAAMPVDGSLAGGMSGGGMFDADGDLIGINVGIAMQPFGIALAPVGISLVVPGNTICDLLARGDT